MNHQEPHAQSEPGRDPREERLRIEIEQLKEKTERLKPHAETELPPLRRPSRSVITALFSALVVLVLGVFVAGYLPRQKRLSEVLAESRQTANALPVVIVQRSKLAPREVTLELPGSIQAVTEAPVLPRADGYLKRRLADIGDRVAAGQVLAEIEAPELDQQVAQARAAVEQAYAAREQAAANLEQGRANLELARLTAHRWNGLLLKGAVSRQENDQFQSQYHAQLAAVEALNRALLAASKNVAVAEANLHRLEDLQGYKLVRAPFAGVVTLRNVDTGALITAGQTMLYRIAQTFSLRTYINVPQANAGDIFPGLPAEVMVADLPGQTFPGRVERTSQALDPSSRTLLVEVRVPNPQGKLLPGMYARVRLKIQRAHPPVMIPGDTLVLRSAGPQVAVIRNGRVHYQTVSIVRDDGTTLEISGGVGPDELLAVNPGDEVRENVAVQAREVSEHTSASAPSRQKQNSEKEER